MSSNDTSHQQSPSPISVRRKHPCVLCQQRKVKCDRNEPCANCTKASIECIPASTLPPRRRKRRFPEAELLARLRRYEHHLKSYGADIDAINREGSQDSGCSVPTTSTTIQANHSDFPCTVHSLSPKAQDVRSLPMRRSLRRVDGNLHNERNDEFHGAEELFQGTSVHEIFANLIIKTYDELGSDDDDELVGPPVPEKLTALHPSPVHIFRLWQTFLDNVHPLIKIFHAPSVQQKVIDATANVEDIPKITEALMFSIYAIATTSMNNDDCQKIFNESKEVVLDRFQYGARRALRIAGCLRSSDIVLLQAFTLYLLSSIQTTIDPRSLFCQTGVAIRVAQRMGISTDGINNTIPPFEAEMRRRLWWQLILIDQRVAELSGAGASMLTYAWDTKLPANVNDSDLFPDMRDPPVERPGPTEMIFVRLRCELSRFAQRSRTVRGFRTIEDDTLEEFERRLERDFLNYCDPSIPLHLMSSMMTKSALCKLQMGLRHRRSMSNQTNDLLQAQWDKMLQLSLRMLEVHNATMKSSLVRRYVWYIYTNFPFPAHVYLLCSLRYRANDEFAERAWQQLSESAEASIKEDGQHPLSPKRKESFLYYAFGNMVVKAWKARESALQNSPHTLPIPHFVSEYRKQLADKRSKSRLATIETSPNLQTDQGLGNLTTQFPAFDSNSLDISQEFDQSMLPGMFSTDLSPTSWDFWNDVTQGGDLMQGMDVTAPP